MACGPSRLGALGGGKIYRQGLWSVIFCWFLMALVIMSRVKKWACMSMVTVCSLCRLCLSLPSVW